MEDLNTVVKRLEFFSDQCPDRELFVFYEEDTRKPLTARDVWVLGGRFASRLRDQGFQKHDVIANNVRNSHERVITDVGVMLAGCTPMNCRIFLKDGTDFFHSARISRCKGIILSPREDSGAWPVFKPHVTKMAAAGSGGQFAQLDCSSIDLPELTTAVMVTRDGHGEITPLIEDLRSAIDTEQCDVGAVDPSDILYVYPTSGSTGFSKLVARRHGEVIQLFQATWGPLDAEALLGKCNRGFNNSTLGNSGGYPYHTYVKGDTRVLLDSFEPVDDSKIGRYIWNCCKAENVALAHLPFAEIGRVADYLNTLGPGEEYRFPILSSGGQPTTKAMVKTGLSIANRMLIGYAITEAATVSTAVLKEATQEDYFAGRVIPVLEVKVVNSDTGEPCATGDVGDILVKHKTQAIFPGYFTKLDTPDPRTGQAFTEDGYLITNDLGYFDKDNNLYVLGRCKDAIMYGSKVVYPAWIEAQIERHPAVKGSCVVPVSDPVMSQRICACVLKENGAEVTTGDLRTFCDDVFSGTLQGDSNSTIKPDYFLLLTEFPYTDTGKVFIQRLRQLAEEKFGGVHGK